MRCRHCNSPVAYFLESSAHWVCESHFNRLLERRVKKCIRQNSLLDACDRVLVAVSGGKDSMTCLNILSMIIGPNPKSELFAVTVDEGIQGKRIDRARDYCKKLGIGHEVISFRKAFGLGIDEAMDKVEREGILACSVCGVLKRRILNDYARQMKATKVATGHNLDDEIQSAFMNFVRGDFERMARLGAKVGVGAHEAFVPRIKPLRDVAEDEIRFYANSNGIPFAQSECPYSKSSLRTSTKKLLNGFNARHPGSKNQLLASVDRLADIMGKNIKEMGPGECVRCGEATAGDVCKTCLLLEKLR